MLFLFAFITALCIIKLCTLSHWVDTNWSQPHTVGDWRGRKRFTLCFGSVESLAVLIGRRQSMFTQAYTDGTTAHAVMKLYLESLNPVIGKPEADGFVYVTSGSIRETFKQLAAIWGSDYGGMTVINIRPIVFGGKPSYPQFYYMEGQ